MTAVLRTLLRADAVVCLVGGTAVALEAATVADHLGLSQTGVVRGFGAFLVVYGLALIGVSCLPVDKLRLAARLTSLSDAGWVAGTAALLAADVVSSGGARSLVLAAIAVGGLGVAKTIALGGDRVAVA